MKQKITMRSKGPSKQLPKSLQDTKPHNLTIYYCLKDNQEVNVKPMIMFAKMKDNVHYNEVDVDTDSYRVLKTPGRKSWAHNKYRLVTHWQPLPKRP